MRQAMPLTPSSSGKWSLRAFCSEGGSAAAISGIPPDETISTFASINCPILNEGGHTYQRPNNLLLASDWSLSKEVGGTCLKHF